MDEHRAGTHECVNPYCDCFPSCGCEAPCTCGLVLVGHTSDEQWDATNGELRYTVTDRYRHAAGAGRGHPTAGATAAEHGAAIEEVVGDAAELLDESSQAADRRSPVLDRYRALPAGHAGHPQETVRTAEYRGHAIEIRTSYQVTIDGEALSAHLMVSDDGNVHYHGLPNYTAASAIELMERVVDAFPEDYPPRPEPTEGGRR
jgi:hypothetical protein